MIGLDKSTQNQDRFTSKAASLGCDDDRERWLSYHHMQKKIGEQQHFEEGKQVYKHFNEYKRKRG